VECPPPPPRIQRRGGREGGSLPAGQGGLGLKRSRRGEPGAAAELGVRTLLVVEGEVGVELGVGVDERGVAFEVDLLVFDGAPEPFDEDVVKAAALAVHRKRHAGAKSGCVNSAEVNWSPWSVLKISGAPNSASAQRTACVQNVAASVLDSSLVSTRRGPPVNDGAQVREAALDWHVGDVGGPDLVARSITSFRKRYG